jgi:integrase
MHEAMLVRTQLHEVRPVKGKVRSLPLDLWPEADRNAWKAACRPAARLNPGGAAGHLKPITREDYAGHYGCFLGFLDRCGSLRLDEPAAANVTVENVTGYIAELKERVGSMRLHAAVAKLRQVAQHMVPGRDFRWLAEIVNDLAMVARPRSKFGRLVTSEVLIKAGLTLINEAEMSPNPTALARACQVRNGLMVAMLAFCPIRPKNFAALEIGRNFVNIKGSWWIVLSASETKERRPDERRVNELLTPAINRYLGQYRPVLAREDNSNSALWLSRNSGAPIKNRRTLREVISATTLATVGVAISPHLFRTCAASSAAAYGGENPYLASALLHHTNQSVTEDHYIRATSLTAAENFRQVIRQYEK